MEEIKQSIVSTTAKYLMNLEYLAIDDKQLSNAVMALIIADEVFEWSDWAGTPSTEQQKLKKFRKDIIRNNPKIIEEMEITNESYKNINMPQTIYTWQRVYDNVDVITVDDISNIISAATTLHPRWNDSEDATIYGTDRFGFGALPSGSRASYGESYDIGNQSFINFFNSSIDNNGFFQIYYAIGQISNTFTHKNTGGSIRAIRPATTEEQLLPDGLISAIYTDYDGNVYQCTKIGLQVWTTSNLKTTHYADGTLITANLTDPVWASDSDGACAVYGKNDGTFLPTDELTTEALMVAAYGRLYNWYAVNNAHGLIDTTDGWHVPTDVEFTQLTDYLIATYPDITIDNVGDALKSVRQVNSPYMIIDN